MRIAFFTVGTCVVLIAVMVAVAYVCNRLNIGTRTTAQQAPLPLTPKDWDVYLAYLQALMECVANNHNTCGLCRPGDQIGRAHV